MITHVPISVLDLFKGLVLFDIKGIKAEEAKVDGLLHAKDDILDREMEVSPRVARVTKGLLYAVVDIRTSEGLNNRTSSRQAIGCNASGGDQRRTIICKGVGKATIDARRYVRHRVR
jgi:hypothetical protein